MLSSQFQPTPAPRSRTSRLRRWIRRACVGGIGLLITVIGVGALYQQLGQRLDARKYSPLGRLVDVGGLRMHIYSSGTGAIPVVLEAGLGGGALDWYQVQPEVAKFTQVVSYDRAGVGWSDTGPPPRSSAQIVRELHDLLNKAGIRSPFVLVGHSLGGLDVQLFAMQYPEEVAGLVLVDSSHVDMAARKEFLPPAAFAMPTLVRVIGSLGLVRLLNNLDDRENLRRLSELDPTFAADLSHEASMLNSHTENLVTMARELASLSVSAAQVRAAPLQLGDKPLFVLTQGGEANPSPERAAIETIWKEWQSDLASRSHNAKHVVAEQSGHYIHQDQPGLVVKAIEQTVQAARDKTKI